MLQYQKATKCTPNTFSNLTVFKPIVGLLGAFSSISEHHSSRNDFQAVTTAMTPSGDVISTYFIY